MIKMDYLPSEILLFIFQKLPTVFVTKRLVCVCQRWKKLIDSQYLHIKQVDQGVNYIHHGLMAIVVLHHIPTIYKISSVLGKVASLPRLRELIIYDGYPLDDNDFFILGSMKCLQHLDVFARKHVLDRTALMPPNLISLVVNNSMTTCFLKQLGAIETKRMTSFHMYGLSLNYKITAMKKFISVNRIHLTDLTLRCNELRDSGYEVIGKCTSLSHLRLYACWLLTRAGAAHLCSLRGLRTLHVTGARMVRRTAMHELIHNLPPRIDELNLSASSFAEEHCGALAGRLPQLRHLELWRCGLAPAAVAFLARSLPALCRLDVEPARPLELNVGKIRGGGEGPSAERYYRWGFLPSCTPLTHVPPATTDGTDHH